MEHRDSTKNTVYYSLLQLTPAHKQHLLSPINLRSGPTENKSHGRYPLFRDVTAYSEVYLTSRRLEAGCLIPLFYCCVLDYVCVAGVA
jgi:hypothetical protein